ncbi:MULTISPECIES: copper homeostasis membrane protein CopD [unclassified Sphingomonas]|uniref:copper homeostasis membrane protein CopD n=1 Tax=Sphingomonas TaxID=13687 RepID=UPI0009640140|nr:MULTISPECIES: copper homeostasis membrane protein CopD [unclassified Sphingomonas]OJY48038.1 MAG: hypothetical protein BGP17_02505 [Sphingomonas sp. 67-41]
METDWPIVATRLALYADLGLLFGVPLFALYALRGEERGQLLPFRLIVGTLAAVGAILSLLGFASMAASMTGTGLAGLDRGIMMMLISETAVGWAFVAREAALILALAFCLRIPRKPVPFLVLASATGAVAVGTLAWSGHAAASEGTAAIVHLAGDIVHLLAASAWLGALAVLTGLMMMRREPTAERVRITHRALAGFATVGSILVALIIVTGVLNGLVLVGFDAFWLLGTTLYGQLLITKIALFAAMLWLAASHRFRLTPALGAALEQDDAASAASTLRRSLVVETVLAFAILALVAWLGTLAPPISG